MNVVLLSRTDNCLLQFQVPHTIVIPGLEANCCDRLICRYIREVYQSRGADRAIDLRIRENRRRPSYYLYHNCAGSKYGVTLVAACPASQGHHNEVRCDVRPSSSLFSPYPEACATLWHVFHVARGLTLSVML